MPCSVVAKPIPSVEYNLIGRRVSCVCSLAAEPTEMEWLTHKSSCLSRNSRTLCPSGLRGWTQVPLAQAAWVQIPQVSLFCLQVFEKIRCAKQHATSQWHALAKREGNVRTQTQTATFSGIEILLQHRGPLGLMDKASDF